MIQTNIIHAAYIHKVKKLLFLGSSCIYPKECPQPIKEDYLLTGPLEPTNKAYALAKISGLKMCEFYRKQYGCDFISAMPTNLYGPGDNFNLETSHVLPALIRKMHLAKCLENRKMAAIRKDLNKLPIEKVGGKSSDEAIIRILKKYGIRQLPNDNCQLTLWGSGAPKREFLYVDDLTDALLFLMINYSEAQHINVGVGNDITIKELANVVKNIVGFNGLIGWDSSKPDGTMQKLLDIKKIKGYGWENVTNTKIGIRKIYNWLLK